MRIVIVVKNGLVEETFTDAPGGVTVEVIDLDSQDEEAPAGECDAAEAVRCDPTMRRF